MDRPLVVMGPSGCGKTTLARELATALGRPFVEGDELHPPENRAKMARGEALTDADRAPFLRAVASALRQRPAPVASCSALKRSYRDLLRSAAPDVLFVLPDLPREDLARRMAERTGHFMPASLLADQLSILEPLSPQERGLTINGVLPVAEQVRQVLTDMSGDD